MKTLSIKNRLVFGFGLMLVILFCMTAISIKSISYLDDSISTVVGRSDRVRLIGEVRLRFFEVARQVRNIALSNGSSEREKSVQIIQKVREDNARDLQYLGTTMRTEKGKELFRKLDAYREELDKLYSPFFRLVNENPEAAKAYIVNDFVPVNAKAIDTSKELDEYIVQVMRAGVEESKADAKTIQYALLGAAVFCFVVAIFVAMWILRSVTLPLNGMRDAIVAVRDKNDFRSSIAVKSLDEVGCTAQAFNDLLVSLRTTLGALRGSTVRMDDSAKQLEVNARESSRAAGANSDAATNMAASIEEMSVSINYVADKAREALSKAEEAGRQASDGGSVITRAVDEMNKIADSVREFSGVIATLGEQSNEISSIVAVIREVADQTNLLALNAAIEAARAGESGRGFAVVADEVRKLAERTTRAAGEIAAMIGTMQNSTQQAVSSMNTTIARVDSGMQLAAQAGVSIVAISQSATSVSAMMGEITHSIVEQSTASQSIAQQVERVAQASEQTSSTAQGTAESAIQLERLATDMRTSVDRYAI